MYLQDSKIMKWGVLTMIQLGIIGTSKIAAQFADAVKDSKAYEFAAIYSRKEDTAKAFCGRVSF